MNVSADSLPIRIYPPPVQTVVVSTKADREVCTGGGCIQMSASHPIHQSVCQSLPLVLCTVVYLNPSYVQIS